VRGAAAYSLGDSDLAAKRLALVARIFDPAARDFLKRSAPRRPRLALDRDAAGGLDAPVRFRRLLSSGRSGSPLLP
jgi:hypothetical protein